MGHVNVIFLTSYFGKNIFCQRINESKLGHLFFKEKIQTWSVWWRIGFPRFFTVASLLFLAPAGKFLAG